MPLKHTVWDSGLRRLHRPATWTLMIAVSWAWVGQAATMVTLINPRTIPIQNPGATLDELAYSEFTDATGKKVNAVGPPELPGASIKPLTDKVPVPKQGFTPVLGFIGLSPKPKARLSVSSTSSGGVGGADATIRYIPATDPTKPSQNGFLDASAAFSIVRPGVGQGFGAVRGVDPDTIPGGSVFDYPVRIDTLSMSVSPGDFGYASLFATDSRFPNPLWQLDVIATAPTTSSPLNYDVSFVSNSLLGLNDGAITAQVRTDLQNSGGTLSNYLLFQTTYSVSTSTVYGEGEEVIVGSLVPEPATWVPAMTAVLVGLGYRCYRRKPVVCDGVP